MKERPLERVVKDIILDLGKRDRLTEEDMASVWEAAAGKRASKHTAPASLKKARLVINVDGSGWLYELTLKKKEILKKLKGRLGDKKVKDIRFRIGEVK